MEISRHSLFSLVAFLLVILVSVQSVGLTSVSALSPDFSVIEPFSANTTSNLLYCTYDENIIKQEKYRSLVQLADNKLSDLPLIAFSSGKALASTKVTPIPFKVTPTPTVAPKNISQADEPVLAKNTESFITPTPSERTGTSQLNADVLFSLVNNHRQSIGLPSFQQDARVCDLVHSRAPELDNEIYGNSKIHAGFQARKLDFFAVENMISQSTEEAALQWWLNSPLHRKSIEGNYQYACVGCSGKSCAMIFTNFSSQ